MSETSLLTSCLKRALRARGFTYADIAIPLELSEASVKRLFSEKSFSLKRMELVCRHIGLSLSDLMKMVERDQEYISQLTEEQETILVSDNRLVLVTLLVFSDWTFDLMQKICTFSKPELIQLLVKLDKLGLIELLANNHFKLLTAKNFSWRANGPALQYFKANIQSDFFSTDFSEANERLYMLTGMLSEERRLEFTKKLELSVLTSNFCSKQS